MERQKVQDLIPTTQKLYNQTWIKLIFLVKYKQEKF